jgi:UrcA family protein
MNKTLLAAGAALLIGGLAAPVLAAEAGANQAVSVAGVNFSNPSDVRDVYVRISRAAEAACDSYAGKGRVSVADRACANRVVTDAVKLLDRPVLTAMHESRGLQQPNRQMASR